MKSFQLATAMMNRLKYPRKFVLISLVFILPLGLVFYFFYSEVQSRVDFAKKEKLGTQFLRPLHQLSTKTPQLQLIKRDLFNQEFHAREVAELESQTTARIQDLEALDRQLGTTLKTTEKFKALQQTWSQLQREQKNWSPETITVFYELLINQTAQLRVEVGDQSNLILDPDLDSYYLMDATLLTLPRMQRTLESARLVSQEISLQGGATTLQRLQLITLLGNLKTSNEELKRNLKVAFDNTKLDTLNSELSEPLQTYTQTIDKCIQFLERPLSNNTPFPADAAIRTLSLSLEQNSTLWTQAIDQLDLLLQRRIDHLIQRLIFLSVFTFLLLTIAAYLFAAFYRGTMQTVSALSAAASSMVDGTLTEKVELNSQDELAEVVHSFNTVAAALVQANQEITVLNDSLQAENVRMGAELDVTRRLQQMILPREEELLSVNGLDIAGFMQPAAEVGGDYYDVLQHDGRVKIGIGDVTGHGLESGVVMIMAQTAVRALLANGETDSVKLMNTVNQLIYQNTRRMNSEKNMTMVLLDYEAGLLRLSGQHEDVIIVRSDGRVEPIDTFELGFPLGLESDISSFVTETKVQLETGDIAVLYTDGITEAINSKNQQYGLGHLHATLQRHRHCAASQIRQAVIEDLVQHIGEQKVFDDITLLVLKQK
jgi:serine phosphatase RsbU (regulator of sigma subunit)